MRSRCSRYEGPIPALRVLGALLLVLGAAWPAHAALAVVQTVTCQAEASATCVTSGVTTTTGNLFVASTGYCCDAFTSITDSKSNSYTDAITELAEGSFTRGRQQYVANGAGGASHTFTLTGGSASFFGTLSVTEVSGAATTLPLDQTATDTDAPGHGTSHATAATGTTAQANEILIGFGTSATNPADYTTDAGAGWTELTNVSTDIDTEGLVTGYRVVAATGTFTYTYTSSTDVSYVHGISTWKEASGTRQRCIGCGIDKRVIGE